MKIVSGILLLLVLVNSSDKLLSFAQNSEGIGRRSLATGKCLVDNPENAGRPLCYIDGEQVDVCSNTGCGGCCGSKCSWIKTYCNEADGVVAKCPAGYSQVGTLSENNNIRMRLSQTHEDSIADCKNLCDNNPKCVAFIYGGVSKEGSSTVCELSGTVTPNYSWGTNFRFCRKTVKCLEENEENPNRPLCFLNEVHHDTCSNKGCNGCCGSTCSWIQTYCSDRNVAECPIGYLQIGTLSDNNDIRGAGLGQSQQESIQDCQALCESTEGCVAFMYGGYTNVHDSKLCELSSSATPDNSWGSNFRFCQMITEESTFSPTLEPTTAPTYLSVSDYELVTDATSCEAVGLETITTTAQCAEAVSALNLAELVESDITVSDYYDRKDGCIWHSRSSEATLFSGSTRQEQPCNYRGYAGCVCASPKFTLVDDAISCEAAGLKTITTTLQCAEAVSALNLAEIIASDVKISDYFDRKDGCIWHEKYSGATLFSGSKRQDKPCNYQGYAGCVCASQQTEEPTTVETVRFMTSEPGQSCNTACEPIGECVEEKLVLQSAEEVASWAIAAGVTCTEIVDRCDIGESPLFNYSLWEKENLCTFCSNPESPGWRSGNRCRARYQVRERICPCATTIELAVSEPGQSCDHACEAIDKECVEDKLVLQSADEVASWALAAGVTCSEIVDRCDIGESPLFNYSLWEKENLCTFCSNLEHPGWLNGKRCRGRYQTRERMCPCASTSE